MNTIIDVIADIIEEYTDKYTVKCGDLPPNGDVLLVCDTRSKLEQPLLELNLESNYYMKSMVQLYVRVSKDNFQYSDVYTDLLNICNILINKVNSTLISGGYAYNITYVSCSDIIYLGVDLNNNLRFSSNLILKYEKIKAKKQTNKQ